jgi:hypothetical protein
MPDVPNFVPGPVGPPNYQQPDFRNPVAPVAVNIQPGDPKGNPMGIGAILSGGPGTGPFDYPGPLQHGSPYPEGVRPHW